MHQEGMTNVGLESILPVKPHPKARNIINGSRLAEVVESHEALQNLLQACENDEIRSADELFDRLYARTLETHAEELGNEPRRIVSTGFILVLPPLTRKHPVTL